MALEIEPVARALHEANCIDYSGVRLNSGVIAPVYIDMRKLQSFPYQNMVIVDAYAILLEGLDYDRIAGIPTAAVPLVSALCYKLRKSQITPRMSTKDHGTDNTIEGYFKPEDTAVAIDDLVTSGESLLTGVELLRNAGLLVHDAVVLLDRQKGGKEKLEATGVRLKSAFTARQIFEYYREAKIGNPEKVQEALDYLKGG